MEVVSLSSLLGAIMGALSGNVGAALVGAVIGASVSAILIIFHETNRERKNRALDLIQEYTSPSFIQVRNEAGRALRNSLDSLDNPSWRRLYHELNQEEWQKISKIEHYYKKLNFMVSINEVDRKYIGAYFSNEFWHWQERYFSKINIASDKPELRLSSLAKVTTQPPKRETTEETETLEKSV